MLYGIVSSLNYGFSSNAVDQYTINVCDV